MSKKFQTYARLDNPVVYINATTTAAAANVPPLYNNDSDNNDDNVAIKLLHTYRDNVGFGRLKNLNMS